MKHVGRWYLAAAVVATFAGLSVLSPAERAPAAFSRHSTAINRPAVGSKDRAIPVPRTRTVNARNNMQAQHSDWGMQFRAVGTNYFEFIRRAAHAAYDGDSAAQYYVGRALARCEETNALYQDADNADQAVSHLAFVPALLELERREYLSCHRLLSETPFEELPKRAGGYPAEYWVSRAIASEYPLAVIAGSLQSPTTSTPQVLAAALATGDAEAMLLFGWTQTAAEKARDPTSITAAAWVLAACHSGANCGPTNDALPLYTCKADIELGCTARYSAIDELSAGLSPGEFERVSLLAQEIQTSLQDHDPSKLMKYLSF